MPKAPPDDLVEARDPLLDLQRSADYCGVSTRWMRRAVEERRIEFVKMGRLVRFRRSALDAFLAANTVEAVS